MAQEQGRELELAKALSGGGEDFDSLMRRAADNKTAPLLADQAADLLIALNSGETKPEKGLLDRLTRLMAAVRSERLLIVSIGTIWREDQDWLSWAMPDGESAQERILRYIASDRPKALEANFWRSVAVKGPRMAKIAFQAADETHPLEAARLLVSLCRSALAGQIEMDIRSAVNGFLEGKDASVRSVFLDEVKGLPQEVKRKLMTHLDMSLMAELDKDALEHRGRSFFYDDEAERQKRDSKSKDIFAEVRRRLDKGEKPL